MFLSPTEKEKKTENTAVAVPVRKTLSIAFVGTERGDFVYYIATLLNANRNTVLVIDNSFANDIYTAVGGLSDSDKCILKQNITYMANRQYIRGMANNYDFVLIYMGTATNNSTLNNADAIIMLPDYTPQTIEACKLVSEANKSRVMVSYIRDDVPHSKLNEKTVAKKIGIPREKILTALDLSIKDYEGYLAFLYNGRNPMYSLTADYKQALKETTRLILGYNKKQINALFRKAEKARTI